eukprot:6603337-Karenia_brevis.AAC.1
MQQSTKSVTMWLVSKYVSKLCQAWWETDMDAYEHDEKAAKTLDMLSYLPMAIRSVQSPAICTLMGPVSGILLQHAMGKLLG